MGAGDGEAVGCVGHGVGMGVGHTSVVSTDLTAWLQPDGNSLQYPTPSTPVSFFMIVGSPAEL